MLNLDPGMIIWTWITFFIVLAILSKVALKPILGVIETREKTIREDLEQAQKQREEAEKLLQILVDIRLKAKRMKNYDLADEIRSRLAELGYVLLDSKDGTKVRKEK